MGNNQPAGSSKEIIHPRLGSIKLTDIKVDNEDVTTMEKVYSINNERQVEEWVRSMSKIKNTETMEVLFLPTKHRYEKGGLCGSSGSVFLTFEDFIFVLDNEIRNREKNERPFLETQIWYLLYNMIRAAKEFERINEKVGDIRPANVVINEDGQIKLISTRTRPGELDNFSKAVESRTQEVYLAPEECNDQYIKTAQYPANIDKLAAQMFTIGVSLLESATLIDCDKLYRRSPGYEFLKDTLEQIKAELHGKYSAPLVNYILKMTDLNPANRPRASKIFSELQPYENQILNLEEFHFPYAQQHRHYPSQEQGYSSSSNYPNYVPQTQQPQQPQYYYSQNPTQIPNYTRSERPVYQNIRSTYNQVPPISTTTYQSRPY